jgi:hypothetical protein
MVAIGRQVPSSIDTLLAEATAIGEAWASECADDLCAQERGVVGAWPGTVSEARSRVLARLPAARARTSALEPETLQLLARAVYDAARKSWHSISEPDLEP